MDNQTLKDIMDAIKAIKDIEKQIQYPDRQGMIDPLKNAKKTALLEITLIEAPLPKSEFKPFEQCDVISLYNNLSLYKKGLEQYCINKVGEEMFKSIYNQN